MLYHVTSDGEFGGVRGGSASCSSTLSVCLVCGRHAHHLIVFPSNELFSLQMLGNFVVYTVSIFCFVLVYDVGAITRIFALIEDADELLEHVLCDVIQVADSDRIWMVAYEVLRCAGVPVKTTKVNG